MASSKLNEVLAEVDARLNDSLERLFALLRIASISTDPAYAAQCRQAAEWLAADLSANGFEAGLRPTGGPPVVLAHQDAPAGPRVLFYGHYDVQPVDPLELWDSQPFAPVLMDKGKPGARIVARGASDDKGQLMTFLEACRAWRQVTGSLPLPVTVMLEGEEECGSAHLGEFIETAADELRADIALICDTDMWDRQTPALVSRLRGMVAEEFEITAASKDLHSGMYGSAARNAVQAIAEIIAGLRTPDGGVAIPGFYDAVLELPDAVAEQWKRLGFDAGQFLADVGLKIPAGEKDRTALEQTWSRPTCEVNGIWGGYTGEGMKTVIPAKARAKITFRLVADQDPGVIRKAFRDHVRAVLPPDCSVEFSGQASAPPVAVPHDGPYAGRALEALSSEWGREAIVIGSGGSIPVVGEFSQRLGIDTLLIGFALSNDQIHSPNEKYDLASFHRGIRSWVRILDALAQAPV